MLAQMRSLTRGWFARIVLGLIALMMAVTLFSGDFLRGIQGVFNPNAVATVAGESISPRELARDLENWVEAQRRSDQPITRQAAIDQGVHLRVLEGIIGRHALHAFAERLGVQASDAQVAQEIRQIQAVQNPLSGSFDRQEYMNFLGRIKYTPAEFEREVRNDLAVQQLITALTAGARAPASFGKLGLAFESERRVVSIAELPAAAAGNIPEPTDAQVRETYDSLRESLRIPEYRQLTLVAARARDFIDRVNIPEERIRQEFEARRARLTQPERRSFVQISASTQAQAQDAAARLARGEDPAAVARALSLQMVSYDQKGQSEVPDAAIGRAAFALRAEAAQAVQGQLTPWAAIRVSAITPGSEPGYAANRDALRAEIAEDEAVDVMNEAVSRFNDARAAGTSLAQAARAQGLAVTEVPKVDAQGRDPEGQTAPALIDQPAIIRAAFETPESEATDFIAAADGADVIVQVDHVFPASVRPFEEVKETMRGLWKTRERARRLEAVADRIKDSVVQGRAFAAAAAAERAALVVRSQEINRQVAARGLPAPQLGAEIFRAREGEVVHAFRGDNGALVVAIVEEIRRADPGQETARVEQMRQQFNQALTQSLAQTVEDAAIEVGKPHRNEALITQLYSQQQQQQDQQ